MANVVVILGAGCSKTCGAPLMADFLDVARDLWLSSRVKDREGEFRRVFEAISQLQIVHSKSALDLVNIESVFSAIDMAKTVNRFPGYTSPQEIEDLLVSMRWVIVRTLEESMTWKHEGDRPLVSRTEDYERLWEAINYIQVARKPAMSVAVITFNYDLALDIAAEAASSRPFWYGLEPKPVNATPLLKLHGSLNWAIDKSTNRIQVWSPREFEARGMSVYRAVGPGQYVAQVGSQLQEWFRRSGAEVDATPALVPPTWNKGVVHQDLARVWQAAAHELSEAEYIYVMGYSLPETDMFFRYLYALGTAGGAPLRRFCLMDPKAEPVAERFERLMGAGARARFAPVNTNFRGGTKQLRADFDGST
jgi:hypothetical protein